MGGRIWEKAQFIIFLSFFDTIGPSLFCVFETGAYRESFRFWSPIWPLKKYGVGMGTWLPLLSVKHRFKNEGLMCFIFHLVLELHILSNMSLKSYKENWQISINNYKMSNELIVNYKPKLELCPKIKNRLAKLGTNTAMIDFCLLLHSYTYVYRTYNYIVGANWPTFKIPWYIFGCERCQLY